MTAKIRMVALIGLGLSFVACGPAGDDSAGRVTPPPASSNFSVKSADEATLAVSNAIRSKRLTTLPAECLQYSVEPLSPEEYVVEVRENHRRPECNGDHATSPHLFDVRVDRRSGKLTTNVNSPSGDFHPFPSGDGQE